MRDFHLYLAQRVSALVLAPLVLGHLAVMIYAVQGGLSAAEILSRTQGSPWWGIFYGVFVAAAAVHGAIGVRNVAEENLRLSGVWLELLTLFVGLVLLVLGVRAVVAVVLW